jgi:hypothetical protein
MWIHEVFLVVTDIVGDPNEALHDIWRGLVSGKVGSLRRRLLSDEDAQDTVLDRTTWRSIRLFVGKDDLGREVVGMHVEKGTDPSIVGPGCIFFLHQSDVRSTWLASKPIEKAATAKLAPFPLDPKGKGDRVLSLMFELGKPGELKRGMAPREVRKLVFGRYRQRWPKDCPPEGDPVSPRTVDRSYKRWLETRSIK